MNGKYLLDTNIIIALFAQETLVIEKIAEFEEIFIPVIVVGELFYGAKKSLNVKSNSKRIEELVANSSLLNCDLYTARQYGNIKNELRKKGRPLPENDIWIAALALQYDLILVTRDQHFNEVESLKTISC